jgi:hypothetical protein
MGSSIEPRLTDAAEVAETGALPFTTLELRVEVRGTAAERAAVEEVAVLVRAAGLAAVVELVAEGRVVVDEAPTTEGLGFTGVVALFGAGAAGRADAADRMLLVDDASVDLLSAGFAATAPGRAVVAAVPIAVRLARPLVGFFSSPDANFPVPSWSDAEARVEVVNLRDAAVAVPAVGRAGGLFKLLPRRDDVAVVPVRELNEEAVGFVALPGGTARFGAAAVARPRFGGSFSNLFTAAATEPGDFVVEGDLGVAGAAVSGAVLMSGSITGSAAVAGGSMGAAATSTVSAMVVVGGSYRELGCVERGWV